MLIAASTALLLVALPIAGPPLSSSALAKGEPSASWVGTWSASPMPADSALDSVPPAFDDQTVRQIVHVSVGGDHVRVRLTNAFGTEPLVIGSAHLALPSSNSSSGSSIVLDSDRPLLFSGQASITIPPGADALSDPLDFSVPALGDLSISLYLPGTPVPTWHQLAQQNAYLSTSGDFTGAAELPVASTASSWFWLSGVEVTARPRLGTLVALGDSITDGAFSTFEGNQRWPDLLSARLNAEPTAPGLSVLNQGISGNRLLHDIFGPNASARFDRDVLAQAGVDQAIVMIGINDLGFPTGFGFPEQVVSAQDLIVGLDQLVQRGHDHGLRIFGATLTPFEGTTFPGYFTPEGEAKRQELNRWIRDGGSFDGVIDFDGVTRDPSHPTQLLPAFDSGDHLHPNDAGYAAMADAVDERLFHP